MPLISVETTGKYHMKDLLSQGKIVQHYLDKAIETQCQDKEWDGYIHPSLLDWGKTSKAQFSSHLNKSYRKPIEAKRRFRFGDLVHYDIQDLLNMTLEGIPEVRFSDEKYKFHGTCDYIAEHKKFGVIYFEFKSFSEYGTDNTNGRRLYQKIRSELYEKEYLHRDKDTGESEKRIVGWGNTDLERLEQRLSLYKNIITEPQSAHITQNATYAWFGKKKKYGYVQRFNKYGMPVYKNGEEVWDKIDVPPADRLCVCYVGKGGYETVEFWYKLPKHNELLERARDNYKAVLKRLKRWEKKNA